MPATQYKYPEFEQRLCLGIDDKVCGRIAWSPNGFDLAAPIEGDGIRVWDSDAGELRTAFTGHKDVIYDVAWLPKGDLVAGARSVAWSPHGTTLASGGADATIWVWDVLSQSGRELRHGHHFINCVRRRSAYRKLVGAMF